ncbi:MAG: peptidoglycan DD-metalloendopeptidase family protein [Stenomitos rutilans HA7619-LM2]|jgi:murein DD-endopeptidase MepM/ murein hydrolase activator NlpD|nr:peptidoglycan DD-metalloendopeptidase family protein [Stenomitos rutilans HA7619-LM2]
MLLWFLETSERLIAKLNLASRLLAGFFCLFLLVGILTVSQPSSAQSDSVKDLQRRQEQIDQQRSQISKEHDRLKNLEKAAQGNLQGLRQGIKATASQIKASEAQLQTATTQLRSLEVSLVKAEQLYRQKQFSTVARLRFLQRQQLDRGWAVLLQSQNLNDFLDRRHQLKQLYKADQQLLSSFKQETDRIDQQRDQVEQQKNQIALLKQQLLAQKAEFEAQASSQQTMIERLRSDRRALEAAETQLLQDSRNIGLLIQQRVGSGGIAFRGTGQMIVPCLGEITSGFGWRMHPILGYQRFHSGLDFGADYGTTINAADSGTVIFAGWYGGYGNAVIIDHGGGITTLYGHTSEIYVSEGQTVQRGQAIAAVGSTGLSTGPHLHFEVRQNGDPVDPAAYL